MSAILIVAAAAMLVYVKWLWTVITMISLGRAVNRDSAIHPTQHEEYAPRVFGWTVAMIFTASSVHLFFRHRIGGEQGWLFMLHLPAALTFVGSLYLMHKYPGTRDAVIHQRVARWILIPSFIITALTGPLLIWSSAKIWPVAQATGHHYFH